jgi:hypothetical protein
MSSANLEVNALSAICAQQVTFAGVPILLRTNYPGLLRYVSDYFPVSTNASIGTAAKVTLIVNETESLESESTPWFRARGQFALARFTPEDALWFNLQTCEVIGNFSRSLAGDRERWRRHIFPTLLGILAATIGIVPVHAGCIVGKAGGILLTAPSGTGKSTLTVALAKRGYAILSDDCSYLTANDSHIDAWGMPVPVKLLPDARKFFPELAKYRPEKSLNGEVAYEVDPEDCFRIPRSQHCRVACVVLLERSETPGCHISFAKGAEAVERLVAELEPLDGMLHAHYQQQIELMLPLAEAVCLRVSFNDHPDAVAKALDHALSFLN